MSATPPPAAGWHLSIGAKVFLLFLGLALAGMGSGLVVHRALTQLDGAATDINRYGSLRFVSQRIQVTLHDAAHGDNPGDAAEVERLIGEFEQTLRRLEADPVHSAADAEAHSHLLVLAAEWPAYRNAARDFLKNLSTHNYEVTTLRRLSAQSAALLAQADRATWALSDGVTRLQKETRNKLAWLGLLNTAILVTAFIYARRRMAQPLRDLARLTLRFARGEHDARSGFRSHDEIGRLAEAFNHMAEETERHILRIAGDLDDIRRQEAELRKLSQAIEYSPACVVITDAKGVIQYVNPAFCEITGWSSEEALGRSPDILKSGHTLPETYRQLWQTIMSGGVWRGELLNSKKNGELFWENTLISSVQDAAGEITHFVAVKEDVTARKHAEQALAMLNIDLEQRVAARTRELEAANRELQAFNHSVSHDLRTPLRAIQGFAEAIAEEGGDSLQGDLPDYLQRIRAAAARMSELIDDLLALGRVGQMELMAQPVRLGRIAREILDGLARREPGRRVEIEVDEDIMVDGDPRLLRIALECLLGNAWKFSAERDPARIVFGHGGAEHANALMVGDNGAGFDMAYADKLFRPFQRLHAAERFAGKGIGLATAKRVIDLHGGRIRAEATPEGGATFYFELPDPRALERPTAPARRAAPTATRATS